MFQQHREFSSTFNFHWTLWRACEYGSLGFRLVLFCVFVWERLLRISLINFRQLEKDLCIISCKMQTAKSLSLVVQHCILKVYGIEGILHLNSLVYMDLLFHMIKTEIKCPKSHNTMSFSWNRQPLGSSIFLLFPVWDKPSIFPVLHELDRPGSKTYHLWDNSQPASVLSFVTFNVCFVESHWRKHIVPNSALYILSESKQCLSTWPITETLNFEQLLWR